MVILDGHIINIQCNIYNRIVSFEINHRQAPSVNIEKNIEIKRRRFYYKTLCPSSAGCGLFLFWKSKNSRRQIGKERTINYHNLPIDYNYIRSGLGILYRMILYIRRGRDAITEKRSWVA